MNLAVRSVQTSADWHSALTKFEDRSIFHTSEWLDTIGETTGFELIRLEVSDRNGPVMLFPLFAKKLGGIVSLLSPPPGLALEFLGPLYRFPPRAKRDRKESMAVEATRLAIEFCEARYHPSLFFVRCGPPFQDIRPFQWLGFQSTPMYTYEIDLRQGLVSVLESFKLELRSEISRMRNRITITDAGHEVAGVIHRAIETRFRAQDLTFDVPVDYLRTLLTRFAPTNMISFLAQLDGSPVGGLVATNYNGVTAAWIGARSVDTRGIPVTDLLVWRAIEWGFEMGATRFELMGGNVQRLRPFKAKYNADLVSFFQLERSRLAGRLLSSAYRHMKAVRTRKT